MKLNTHDRTPRPKNSRRINTLYFICAILSYSIFGLVSFACFYYAKSIIAGILVILLPISITAVILIQLKDIEKAYIEITDDEISVVDYYWGIKIEKRVSFSDITSAEICLGSSHKVRGYRFSALGMRYIVFRHGKNYLFKIIYLPETEQIFKQYLQ